MNDIEEKCFENIRKVYNVPAKIGTRIEYRSKPGVIVGTTGAYLRIRLDGETEIKTYHPTWEIEYL